MLKWDPAQASVGSFLFTKSVQEHKALCMWRCTPSKNRVGIWYRKFKQPLIIISFVKTAWLYYLWNQGIVTIWGYCVDNTVLKYLLSTIAKVTILGKSSSATVIS